MAGKYTRTHLLLAIFIFICSLVYRISFLDTIEFKTDEATNLFLATRPLFGHHPPPATTASSLGILNPPLLNYLLLPLGMISMDPRVISALIGFLNSLAIVGFFLILYKYHGQLIALMASLLFAFSPWAVLFSRKIWAQDFMVPLVIFVFWSIHKIIIDRDTRFWFVYTFFSMLLIQIHQVSIVYVLLVSTGLLLQAWKKSFLSIILGILLGLVPLVPFIKYEISHNCPDCVVVSQLKHKLAPKGLAAHFLRPLQIPNQGNFQYILGDGLLTLKNNYPLAFHLRRFFYIEYILILLGLYIFYKKNYKLRIIPITITLLPLCYFVLKIEQPIHYYIILLPSLFLILAYSINLFLTSPNRILSLSGRVCLFGLVLTSILFNDAFYSLLRTSGGTTGDYGKTYAIRSKPVIAALEPFKSDSHYNEMLITHFIDTQYFHGTMPVPRMLYERHQTQKKLNGLYNRLQSVPDDKATYLELLAYFTDPPTRTGLETLYSRANSHPALLTLYHDYMGIYDQYIFTKGMRLAQAEIIGLRFEIPADWNYTQTLNDLYIGGDDYSILVSRLLDSGNQGGYRISTGRNIVTVVIAPADVAPLKNPDLNRFLKTLHEL